MQETFFVGVRKDRSCHVSLEDEEDPAWNVQHSGQFGQYQFNIDPKFQALASAHPGASYAQRYTGLVPPLLGSKITDAVWQAHVLRPLQDVADRKSTV